jgi:hypothetical protein
MADLIGRTEQRIGRAYSSDNVAVTFNVDNLGENLGVDHLIAQNVGWGYNQNVTRLFDLTDSRFQAYVSTRPQGTLTMAHVVSEFQALVTFMQQYGDVCNASNNGIDVALAGTVCDFETDQTQLNSAGVHFSYPVLTASQMAMGVNDYLLTNSMTFIFAAVKPIQ